MTFIQIASRRSVQKEYLEFLRPELDKRVMELFGSTRPRRRNDYPLLQHVRRTLWCAYNVDAKSNPSRIKLCTTALGLAAFRYACCGDTICLEQNSRMAEGALMESKLGSQFAAWKQAGGQKPCGRARIHLSLVALLSCFVTLLGWICLPNVARADEGGVSFWIPGFFGSLAAAPQQPGFSMMSIYYHTTVSGGGAIGLSREFQIRNIPAGVSATLNGSVHGTGDLGFVFPNYTFATPVFGGQATFGILAGYGNVDTNVNGTLAGTATVGGATVPFMRTDSLSDSVTGFSDLIPMFTLRWNAGVNNYMTYFTGDIPVGAYDSMRLSNIGIGHGAIDSGVGYTYFDEKAGHEFSAVTGVTYNFTDTATDYRNGIDWHLDWGASQFLTKQLQVGLVGYFYDQLTADQGCLQVLCPFKSQVMGVGPQIGYIFPVAGMQGYINLKGYGEFDGHDRPSGWNTWLTFVLSPAPPAADKTPPPMLTKGPHS